MALQLIKKDEAYVPNLQDKRVRKRVVSVLDWCDRNLYENTVVNLRSVPNKTQPDAARRSLSEVFGQQQTALSKWLRHQLLIQVGGYEPGKMNYGYRLREGAIARLRGMVGEAAVAMNDLQTYEQSWARELDTLTFNYLDKSSRLWHPLQNMRREDKDAFWANYLPYDYDISACAPNLLAQTARFAGLPEEQLAGVQKYLDEKSAFREHVKALTGLTAQQSKAVINSLFNGARLLPHHTCSTYEKLGYDREALDRLKNDPQVQELLQSIKDIWHALAGAVRAGTGSKWNIYFRLEREIIDVVHQYLREADNAFFSEHDGWRCAKPVDTAALEKLVLERTGYALEFA